MQDTNQPYFSVNDLKLCKVPVPEGYPQSQTHAGIAVYNGDFYLTCSPYPLLKYTKFRARVKSVLQKLSKGRFGQYPDADGYENPLLYKASVGDYIPTEFELLLPAPLIEKPIVENAISAYNSDPDICIDNGRVYILNRAYSRFENDKGDTEQKVTIFLILGSIDDGKFKIEDLRDITKSENSFLSPCLTKLNDKYIYTHIESNSAVDGKTFGGIYLSLVDSIEELNSITDYQRVEMNCSELLPWHMSLFSYDGVLYTIITCTEKTDKHGCISLKQYLGKFDDSLDYLHIYQRPLIALNSYRGSACVLPDGGFVLYSTTVYEKLKGSISVDGRDIVVASTKFSELLTYLNDES